MKFIDVHSHVQFAAYDRDRDAVIQRARESETEMINVGTQYDTSLAAVELARNNPDICWATIGLHPIHASKSFHDEQELGPSYAKASEGKEGFTSRGEVFDYYRYLELGKDPNVVAIGECGLDYYRLTEETKKAQEEAFIQQIELANELHKPLMLHIRNGRGMSGGGAYDDTLELVKAHAEVQGDVHFFAGDWATAKQWLDAGFTLSFTGVVTFTKDYDEVVKNTPLDMIMAETDSPYVSPAPLRGKRNEPVNVKYVVEKIAELKALDIEVVREAIIQNAKRVFRL